MAKKVAVIGAGFGGLSAAALLAKRGFDVTVYEKNASPGGRAMLYREKGFTFDMGPSWYLMPDVFERFFAEFGKTPSDYLKITRLDPSYRVFFGDEGPVDVAADLEKNYSLFDNLEPGGGEMLRKYLVHARRNYELAMSRFVYRDYKSLLDFADPRLLIDGIRLGFFNSMDSFVRRYFKSHKSRKILEYTMVFLGGSPSNTPALYSIMSHVDLGLGVYYPDGGIGALAMAMHKLACEQGVSFRFNSPVSAIVLKDGIAQGVEVKGRRMDADVVVADADYQHVETRLLPVSGRSYDARYWHTRVMAPSAFLIYLGLKRKIKGLSHHNLFLARDWERHFAQIFDRPSWPDDPSYYVSCPSKTDRTVAPEGKDCLFILVPVAAGLEDGGTIRKRYYEKIVSHLEKLLGENIRDSIEVKRIFTHRDFSALYNSYKGTALGLSHTISQTALWRPSHRSRKIRNLFFTGHYTHPGVGVPITIISSHIVTKEIADSYGQ